MKPHSSIMIFLVALILSNLIVAGCTELSGSRAPVLPALEQRETDQAALAGPGRVDPVEPASLLDTQQVLEACSVGSQAVALRSGYEPVWQALGLGTCYELAFDLTAGLPGYTGKARVTYANQTDREIPDLVFRLYPNADRIYGGELRVSSAHIDGLPVATEVYLRDRTALRLFLEKALLPGDTTVVELEFSGRLPVDREDLPGVYGIFNFDSAAEVLTLANGYPILATWENGDWRADPVSGIGDAVVSETALYRVQVAAPAGWQVVATGTGVERVAYSEGESLEFVTGPVREFTLIASPHFVVNRAEVEGVRVYHWGLPGGEDRWENALQAAVDSLALFEGRFGPYPYLELDVVAVPLWLAAGVEYPGLILLRQALYQPGPGSSPSSEYVVAHEVAHQWWYGVVGNDVLEHPWQDEALATFSALLYLEEYHPLEYTGTLQFYRGRVAELESEEGHTDVAQPVEAFRDSPGAYSPVVYVKGGLFFAELRERLGDQTFFRALQEYYAQNMYGLPSPQALLDSFEQACACVLDTVYQEWGVRGSNE